jgi:hypothetical protein
MRLHEMRSTVQLRPRKMSSTNTTCPILVYTSLRCSLHPPPTSPSPAKSSLTDPPNPPLTKNPSHISPMFEKLTPLKKCTDSRAFMLGQYVRVNTQVYSHTSTQWAISGHCAAVFLVFAFLIHTSLFLLPIGFSRFVHCSTSAKTLIRDFRKTALPQRF